MEHLLPPTDENEKQIKTQQITQTKQKHVKTKIHRLRQLQWFRVPNKITFKLETLMFQCVNGTAPGYLSIHLTCDAWPMYTAENTYVRQHHPH